MESILILLTILVPLLTGALLLLAKPLKGKPACALALLAMAFTAGAAVHVGIQFLSAPLELGDYKFIALADTGLMHLGISLMLGLNGISMPLFVMAGLVGFAAAVYAAGAGYAHKRIFLGLLLIMQAGLMGMFASLDLFYFFLFHEIALVPTFLLMLYWGSQGKRTAAIEMAVYLGLGGLLVLGGLIFIFVQTGLQSFNIIDWRAYFAAYPLSTAVAENVAGILLLGFGILVSLWPLHSWAPRGYASAPAPVAMLHAGVLKKFGLYGILQVLLPVLGAAAFTKWVPLLMLLALGNILIMGLVAMAQRDVKLLAGTASVMHMGYAFLGLATLSTLGHGGVVLFMVAHGLTAGLMFLLADSITTRAGTADMHRMGGLGAHLPSLAFCFGAVTFASIGLPGFANFWGEFVIFMALWQWNPWACGLAALGIVISAMYGLRAFARIFMAKDTNLPESVQPVCFDTLAKAGKLPALRLSEKLPATLLILALLIFGLWPKFIAQPANQALEIQQTVQAYLK